MPAPVVIAATASASHDGLDAVSRSHAAGTGASAAAHGIDPADAATDAAADATDAASGTAGATGTDAGRCNPECWRQSQQLILKGFDDIETFSGGEEQWQNWSGMSGELMEMLITAGSRALRRC